MLITVPAAPEALAVDPARTALLVIDMQRDFLEPGGFGASLGNDVEQLAQVVEPCARLLQAARSGGRCIVHTREGHTPDLADLPESKALRGPPGARIGDPGPMGRILIRGEPGHAIVEPLTPGPGELVIDKAGKGAFYGTPLDEALRRSGIHYLVLCGVTTEVCVHSTTREANDRGYECLVVADACGSYFPAFHDATLAMVQAQGGIFGRVTHTAAVCDALAAKP